MRLIAMARDLCRRGCAVLSSAVAVEIALALRARTGRDTTLRGGSGAVHRGTQPKLQGVEAYQFNEKYLTGNAALAAISLVPSRQFRGPLLASEKDYTMRKLFRRVPYTGKDAAPYHEAYG